MEIFFKFQDYVDEGNRFQDKMEKIKCIVEDISVVQANCHDALTKISEMSSCKKE